MRNWVFLAAIGLGIAVASGCDRGANTVKPAAQTPRAQAEETRDREDAETLKAVLEYVRDRSPAASKLHQERVRIAARLPEERRAARATGIPIDVKDFPIRRVPNSENAAVIYVELHDLLRARPLRAGTDERAAKLGPGSALSPEGARQTIEVLAERDDVRDLLKRLVARPRCYIEHDWSDITRETFPEYVLMRRAARLIHGDAVRLAQEGKPAEALRLLTTGTRIIEHSAGQPGLLGYYMAVAISSILMNGLDAMLQIAGSDPTVCQAVARVVNNWQVPQDSSRATAEETAAENAMWRRVSRGDLAALVPTAPPQSFTPAERQRLRVIAEATQAVSLSRLRRIVAARRLVFPERLRRLSSFVKPGELSSDPVAYVPAVMDENAFGAARVAGVLLARRGALRLGALILSRGDPQDAAFAKRLVAGSTDPLTGRPFRFRKRVSGFAVYSPGIDGSFDGEPRAGVKRTETAMFMYPAHPWPE